MAELTKQDLLAGKVWVQLTYPDLSQFCFQTTLNTQLLNQEGIVLEQGKLPRLDKKYYISGSMQFKQFPFAGATVRVFDCETYTDENSRAIAKYL